jgi:uncharacterized protein YdhG (YjbR/CyaY superfamily)
MNKQNEGYKNIDEYIGKAPSDTQHILQEIRAIVKEEAPDAVEAISYQMPTFKLNGKNLVHFAGWANHIGFYPTPTGTAAFTKELEPYAHAKGSVQFPLDKPIPYDLIRKIIKYRVEEISKK